VPTALNLFMNVPVAPDGSFKICRRSAARDHVSFRAELDCVIALSACPSIAAAERPDCRPQDVEYLIGD